MNNNVLIKISGLQMVDDTGDNVESMSAGKYYLKKEIGRASCRERV